MLPFSSQTLDNLITEAASRFPYGTAILSDGRTWTYGELERGILRSAALLNDGGIKKGDRILLMSATSDAFVFAFFALLRVGAIPVPIHPDLQEVEVLTLARDSGARWLLTDMATSDQVLNTFLQARNGTVIRLDPRRLQIRWRFEPGAKETPLNILEVPPQKTELPSIVPETMATLLYPHSDTEHSKGIGLSHRDLLAHARSSLAVLPVDRFPSTTIALPLHHANVMTGQLLTHFLVGGRVQLFRNLAFAFPVLQAIQKAGSQSFWGMPTTFRQFANLPDLDELDLRCVRYVNVLGASLSIEDRHLIARVFPEATVFHHDEPIEASPRLPGLVSSGEKVLPREVERVFASHPQVQDVRVCGEADRMLGDRIIAYVIPSSTHVDLQAIRQHGERHLAPFKWPQEVRIVDRLPD